MHHLRKLFSAALVSAVMLFSVAVTCYAQEIVTHIVQRGETIESIAGKYGTTADTILRLNPDAADFVYVGMELKIEKGIVSKVLESEPAAEKKTDAAIKAGKERGREPKECGREPKEEKSVSSGKAVGIDMLVSASAGYSDYACAEASPKSRLGFSIDLPFRFSAMRKVGFFPENYYMEASVGYALKGSAAYPAHYVDIKLAPAGYSLPVSNVEITGKAGLYVGIPVGGEIELFANKAGRGYSYPFGPDVGIDLSMGISFGRWDIGFIYERGFTDMSDVRFPLHNQRLTVYAAFKLFHF